MRVCPYGLFAVLVLALAGPACGSETEAVLIEGVAARVNKHTITIGEVLSLLEPVQRQLREKYAGDELRTRLKDAYRTALDALIDRHLILDAFKQQNGKIPDWVVEQRIDEVIRELFDGEEGALMDALAEDRLTYEEWRDEIRNQIILSSMRSAHVEQQVYVSPAAVRETYNRNRGAYRLPAKVRLRMIVLESEGNDRVVARRRAKNVRQRALDGDDFASLARNQSSGEHAEEGGDWGWIEPRILRRELAAAVSELKPGKISEVIETPGEFYILKVEGRTGESVAPFEEVREEIERELRREAADKLYRDWIRRLRAAAYIEILDADVF